MSDYAVVQKKTFNLLPSTAKGSAQLDSGKQYNRIYQGIRLTINLSAFTGTSVTFTLQGIDPISGNAYTLLESAAKNATGTFTLTLAPGIAASSNVAAQDILPSQWKLITTGTFTVATYSVHAELLP